MHSGDSLFLLLTFLELCSILCSTNSWAENRMVNVGLCFYCIVYFVFKANLVPVLFYITRKEYDQWHCLSRCSDCLG
jgi:hypothetical protein